MTYNDWVSELKFNLLGLSAEEEKRVLDYYAEAYADRKAAGFSEQEILDGFGTPAEAAQAIREGENSGIKPESQNAFDSFGNPLNGQNSAPTPDPGNAWEGTSPFSAFGQGYNQTPPAQPSNNYVPPLFNSPNGNNYAPPPPYQGGNNGFGTPPYQGTSNGYTPPPYPGGNNGFGQQQYPGGNGGFSQQPNQGTNNSYGPPPYPGTNGGYGQQQFQGGNNGFGQQQYPGGNGGFGQQPNQGTNNSYGPPPYPGTSGSYGQQQYSTNSNPGPAPANTAKSKAKPSPAAIVAAILIGLLLLSPLTVVASSIFAFVATIAVLPYIFITCGGERIIFGIFWTASVGDGFVNVGLGLILVGLGIILIRPCFAILKWLWRLLKKFAVWIRAQF